MSALSNLWRIPLGGVPLVILLAGCPAPSRPPVGTVQSHHGPAGRPAWFPDRPCREAWARLPPTQSRYDFKQDSQKTDRGNLGYAGYAARVERKRCYKKWTLLVYMAADNDLTKYAYLDLYEMEAAGAAGERTAS